MHNDFSPEPEDQLPEQKNSQQLLLLLLLLLILLFAYLYFFTGLIKPRPQAAPTQNVASEGPVVKKPLPPRPSAGPETAAAGKPGTPAKEAKAPEAPAKEAKPAAGKEAKAGQPAPGKEAKPGQPAQGKAAQGAKPAANAPEAKAAKPAAPGKAEKPAAAEHKAEKTVQAGLKTAKPAGAAAQAKGQQAEAKGAKPAAPGQGAKGAAAGTKGAKAAQAKKAEKPQGGKAAAAQAGKGKLAAKPAAGGYALVINGDLAESEIAPVVSKLKRAGVGQVVKTRTQKGESMHRLFLADFGDKGEAQEELERLKLAAPSAFMLKENGRYAVYAGSYLREAKASQEQERLYAKGVKLVLKTATAQIPVVKLRAGSFADKAAAEKAADRLKKGGVQAKVVKVQK